MVREAVAASVAHALSPTPTRSEVLDKSFDPAAIEQRWYQRWESAGYFTAPATTSTPAYCIQLPPPNVTGTLHMGHAFQQTLMDALIRYHRMRGFNTNWVVGTDHAGIATQIVVERQLEDEGKTRHDLGREKFVERVWQWKQQSGSTITRQMRRLGASANWDYADTEGQKAGYFTMDAKMSRAVVEVFVRLLRGGPDLPRQAPGQLGPGARHRGVRPRGRQRGRRRHDLAHRLSVRRRPAGLDRQGRQPVKLRGMTIATTRPETMLGDGAVAVHPDDPRYRHLVGKQRHPAAVRPHHPGRRRRRWSTASSAPAASRSPARTTSTTTTSAMRHSLPLIVIFTLDAKMNENGADAVPGPGPLRRAQGGGGGPRARELPRRRRAAQADGAAVRAAPARWSSRCSPTSGS